ncbi:MAG TPA: pentapeptide repeat-containing protein [Ktedonobacteraceae bacterium]
MNIDVNRETQQEDKPLTKEDVIRLLEEAGSSSKLDLSGRNLQGIDLPGCNLTVANLSRADLRNANLSRADLRIANLSGADLRNADLSGADLAYANLSGANLVDANLGHTDLRHADLREALLFRRFVGLSIKTSETTVVYSDMAFLHAANLTGARLTEETRKILQDIAKTEFFTIDTDGNVEDNGADNSAILRIGINEEPLTPNNLITIISALTELSTKYWLIAKRRFADLIEYTQTHDARFAEEAQLAITRITYNSPFNMDWKVDISAPSVAEAIVTTIDGIKQRDTRLGKAELENEAKAQEIKQAEQQAEQQNQMATLEQEQKRLEIESQRLALLEQRLEVQKKGIEFALEIAEKTVDMLHPSADAETRAMIIQTLLPNILQLQNGKGLELALLAPKKEGKK